MYIELDEKQRNYNVDKKGTQKDPKVRPGFRVAKQPKVKGRKKNKALNESN